MHVCFRNETNTVCPSCACFSYLSFSMIYFHSFTHNYFLFFVLAFFKLISSVFCFGRFLAIIPFFSFLSGACCHYCSMFWADICPVGAMMVHILKHFRLFIFCVLFTGIYLTNHLRLWNEINTRGLQLPCLALLGYWSVRWKLTVTSCPVFLYVTMRFVPI